MNIRMMSYERAIMQITPMSLQIIQYGKIVEHNSLVKGDQPQRKLGTTEDRTSKPALLAASGNIDSVA